MVKTFTEAQKDTVNKFVANAETTVSVRPSQELNKLIFTNNSSISITLIAHSDGTFSIEGCKCELEHRPKVSKAKNARIQSPWYMAKMAEQESLWFGSKINKTPATRCDCITLSSKLNGKDYEPKTDESPIYGQRLSIADTTIGLRLKGFIK